MTTPDPRTPKPPEAAAGSAKRAERTDNRGSGSAKRAERTDNGGSGSAKRAERPDRGEGRSRSSLTGRALILALVAVTLFLTLAGPVRTWFAQRAEIAELRADVEATRERVAALQIEQERWDDPAFIAAEARRRLHFVLPGEVGYVTLGMETTEEEQAAAAAAADLEWYSTLWSAVREADTGSSGESGTDEDGAAKKDAAGKKDDAANKDVTKRDTAE